MHDEAEFVAKLQIVVEEAEESVYWLDVIARGELLTVDLRAVREEADELLAIFASSLDRPNQSASQPDELAFEK